jgi:hypothetical protein
MTAKPSSNRGHMTATTEQSDETAILNRLGKGVLPSLSEQKAIGLPMSKVCELWVKGMGDAHRESQRAASDAFRATGDGAAWYLDAEPLDGEDEAVLEQTEEAIDIVESLYDPILEHGERRMDGTIGISDEDCLLKVSRLGNSEGILVKQAPYGHEIKVIITGHTGPRNYNATDRSVEFEPGCKAFRFRLAYEFGMPSKKQLVQDVAAYLKLSKERKGRGYFDEGGTGPASRNVPFHKSLRIRT